jgi:hypothetical protein
VPYPFAHPAAVLPLARPMGRLGVPAALVIGSMVPDAWYLVPGMVRADSHSFAGLFWFCLPVGLLAYVGYYRILRNCRIPAFPPIAVACSILVGALTHVAWDAVAHSYAYEGVHVLQHASTVFGAAFVVWWCSGSVRLAAMLGALLAATGMALFAATDIAALRSALREAGVALAWIAGLAFVAWRVTSRS